MRLEMEGTGRKNKGTEKTAEESMRPGPPSSSFLQARRETDRKVREEAQRSSR